MEEKETAVCGAHAVQTQQLEFQDPRLFRDLLGQHDQHVKIIQHALGVHIRARGSGVEVSGDSVQVDLATRLIKQLYGLLEKGYPVYASDVDYAIRILSADSRTRLQDIFLDTIYISAHKRTITPKSIAQKAYIDAIRRYDIVFGIGPAGTGKTYLAMAMAVAELMKNNYVRIILTRPAVEAGEKLGFLPGDLAEKVNPYLRPLYDALHDMVDFDRAHKLVERGTIEVAPLAFMRGRTLNDSFVILDEAQNTTPEQMKMFLTRLGYGSKAVITGDATQIDLPAGKPSGLKEAVRILKGVHGIRFVTFTEKDVARHHLVQEIIAAYERDERQAGSAENPSREPVS
ncbi:MAG TPA: PhoH family protein [candidate division Zixibacteria bacterium]|nr:PhoH family protein [candidate division Zixibacteria bacterium]